MEKKLNLFGHVCRMTDAETGSVWNNGGSQRRRRGRPRRRWTDGVGMV